MSDQDHEQTQLIKTFLEKDLGPYNPEHSLHKTLRAAKTKNATKDIFTLFTAWVWVLFSGFGVSIYTEVSKRKYSNKKKTPTKKSNHLKK